MHLTEGNCYHIYNRGNQKQTLFFSEDNCIYFLKKVNQYISPTADILSWCLMPNHFHLLIHANERSVEPIQHGSLQCQRFSNGIRMLLSSYTKAINKQEGKTGNLFQQKTKAKEILRTDEWQLLIAFHYIYQNPLKAKLVSKMEDWRFSS